ncbi:unnamed protein product [Peniophora sp. CBMAI 1063]|nr:unnamed protein product [Peniophora sp. CBMAI 1063]
MSQHSQAKPVAVPTTGRRACRTPGGYHEQHATQSQHISIGPSGNVTSSQVELHIPQTPLDQLEPTLRPATAAAPQTAAADNEADGDGADAGNDATVAPQEGQEAGEDHTPKPKKVRHGVLSRCSGGDESAQNHPLLYWIPHRLGFLRALLRLDGRPKAVLTNKVRGCAKEGCSKGKQYVGRLYRCVSANCIGCTWWCGECILESHKLHPLDRIEVWLNDEWQPSSLGELGLVVQFGHWNGTYCRLPRHPVPAFMVLHTNGLHQLNVRFCNCATQKASVVEQLLAGRWYPATSDAPRTAATFEVLDAFNAHSGSGKDNAYDFYNALEYLTNGSGLFHLPNLSKQFFTMAHEYRHLLSLKRGGRGHDAQRSIKQTYWGELAMICPACPHDGINTDVVDKLRLISPELADNHALFNDLVQLSMDCNFRAKNRMTRSTQETSPYLGDGMAYMVPEKEYDDFIRTRLNDEELSNCSRFGALVLANLKTGKGLRTTGVGAVFCSRHEFFWPNTVGTLIKGERHSTMDFIFAAAVRRVRASSLHIYYDIICQYTRKLNLRMLEVEPRSFVGVGAQKILHKINVSFGIPKFHNPGHLVICQLWFNLAYLIATGQTDGEASERAWAGLNPAASSLREMGPGTMRDTIDFYCSFWNWRKFIHMGGFLQKKMEIALREAREHCETYTALHTLIWRESRETAIAWVSGSEKWETRNALDALGRQITSGPEAVKNPYESSARKQSLEKARLESAELASKALNEATLPVSAEGLDADAVGETTTSASQASAMLNFVLRGFKIEVMQWRTSRAVATKTVLQTTERVEKRNELAREMRLFRKDQQWMMPVVYAALQELEGVETGNAADMETDDEGEDDQQVESHKDALFLPSELEKDVARTAPMLDVLLVELRLRYAGMEDWLENLRQQLRVRGTVAQWKISYGTGQRMATRTINKQRTIQENVVMAREMYRLHRERYETLVSFLTDDERAAHVPPKWDDTFRVLHDEECRPLNNSLLLAIDAVEIQHIKDILSERRNGVASGASSYRIPWIWYKVAEGTEVELNDDLRVEFVKSRARAMRWVEEVYKLAYEMVRVPAYCSSRSIWWAGRAEVQIENIDLELQDGIRGYATKQSTMFRRHAEGLEDHFKGSLEEAAAFVRVFGLDGLIKNSTVSLV